MCSRPRVGILLCYNKVSEPCPCQITLPGKNRYYPLTFTAAKVPKLIQEETESRDASKSPKELEFVIKTHKTPGPDDFPGEFCLIFKKNKYTLLHSLPNIRKRWISF